MAVEPFTTPRATRGASRTAVHSLDPATFTRLAWMRREIATTLKVPINNSLLVRFAIALAVKEIEKRCCEGDDMARLVLAAELRRHADGEHLGVSEKEILNTSGVTLRQMQALAAEAGMMTLRAGGRK